MMYFGQTEIIRTVLLECIVFTQVLSTCTLTADDVCTVRIVRLEEIGVIPTAVATVFDADGQVLDRFQIGKHALPKSPEERTRPQAYQRSSVPQSPCLFRYETLLPS